MAPRRSPRRFVRNKRTGAIAIRSTAGMLPVMEERTSAFNFDEMLSALIEVEAILSPGFAQERVPPHLTIAFLADAIYLRLTGEAEIGSPKLRVMLCQFVLAAWSSGEFTPSPAFPYTYDQVAEAFTTPLEEREDTLDDDQIAAALALAESLSREELLSPENTREIDRVLEALIVRGLRFMRQKLYDKAAFAFLQATRLDLRDESEARYLRAMALAWQGNIAEASALFAEDQQDRAGLAPLSWLFAEYSALCIASSRAAYLAALGSSLEDEDDPLSSKEELFEDDYGEYADDALHPLAAALFAYLDGDYQGCLTLLDGVAPDVLDIPPWVAPFWRAMALAELGRDDDAHAVLKQTVAAEIPPMFLLPLRWFERSHPDFYERVVRPLFTQLDLWPLIAICNRLEQEAQQARVRGWVEQTERVLPGFAQVREALERMRKRFRSGIERAELECRYLADPLGEDLVYAYVGLVAHQGTGEGRTLPVFLAEIPPPCSPRPSTYLVTALLDQLSDPLAHKRVGEEQKRRRLIQVMRERGVELAILTGVENLTTPAGTRLLLNEIEWLRHLFVNEIGNIPLLLVGDSGMIEHICEANTDFGRLLNPLLISG